MNVQKIFREQRAVIVEGWINAVYSTYPLQTTGFLRTKNDPFTNPVGDMTKEAAGLIYDVIAGEHVTPRQGLGVFFLMKPLLREHILPLCREKEDLAEYLDAESRLDSVTLLAFDLYSAARETLAETRIAEIRNQHAQLVRWAQSVDGSPVSGKS